MEVKQRFVLFIVHFYYTFHASLKEVFKLMFQARSTIKLK